jgi:hypothetical protein
MQAFVTADDCTVHSCALHTLRQLCAGVRRNQALVTADHVASICSLVCDPSCEDKLVKDAFATLKVVIRSSETKQSFISANGFFPLVRCLKGTAVAEGLCVLRALVTQTSKEKALDDVFAAIATTDIVELIAGQLLDAESVEHRASCAIALFKLASCEEARLQIARLLPPPELAALLEANQESPTTARFLLGLLRVAFSETIWQAEMQQIVPVALASIRAHASNAAVVQFGLELLVVLSKDGPGMVEYSAGLCECITQAFQDHDQTTAVHNACADLICGLCASCQLGEQLLSRGARDLVMAAYVHEALALRAKKGGQHTKAGGAIAAAILALGLQVPMDETMDGANGNGHGKQTQCERSTSSSTTTTTTSSSTTTTSSSSTTTTKHYAGKYQYGHGLATDNTGSMPNTDSEAGKFLVGNPEKCDLNQYWYSDHTIQTMVREVEQVLEEANEQAANGLAANAARHGVRRKARAALVSTPSIYFPLAEKHRCQSHVLEFDNQWAADRGFVFYDFNKPLEVPEELQHTFDMVVVDPPFVTEEVWTKYASTAKLLLRPGGRLVCTTIAENAEMMYRLLKVQPVAFKPSIPNLVYQYLTYTNYEDTKHLAHPNEELGE